MLLVVLCVFLVLFLNRPRPRHLSSDTPALSVSPITTTAVRDALREPGDTLDVLLATNHRLRQLSVARHRNTADAVRDVLERTQDAWPSDPDARQHINMTLATARHGRYRYSRVFELIAPQLTVADSPPPTTVVFKDDEPRWLADYHGQPHITAVLDLHLRALDATQLVMPHKLLTGLPGFGKTLLAKIIAHELQHRAQQRGQPAIGFVETYAANLNSVKAMDAVVRELQRHSAAVWFIDELHVINDLLATKLYLLMEEGRYPFEGSLNPTTLPPIMVIGATTDYGMLHPALKRRFGEALMMRPMSRDALQQLAASMLPTATPEAQAQLVERCVSSGAPHELKTLAKDTLTYAKAHGQDHIDADVLHEVFQTWEIDQRGLRPVDRRVLETLYRRPKHRAKDGVLLGYGASEADICAMSGLDPGEFRAVIRPRLMARGYIEVRSGFGLRLTDHAMQDYPKATVCG